jgi:transmembrane sensor
VENEAAEWLARRESGFDAACEARFRAWLEMNPRHAAVFSELEAAWAAVNRPRQQGRGAAWMDRIEGMEAAARRQRTLARQRWGAIALAAAAAVVVGFIFLRPTASTTTPVGVARTVDLRPNRQELPDGSKVELNASGEIQVEFSPRQRRVHLRRGEALFEVAKDASRPFVVVVGGVEVRAVGTAFAVRYDTDHVRVLVTEGHVAVERAADGKTLLPGAEVAAESTVSPPPPLAGPTLKRGQWLEIPAPAAPLPVRAIASVTPTELADALAWRYRRVEFSSTSLAEAVPLFNQQGGVRLVLANPETAALQISGVFWTDDTEAFARLLESSLGLSAVHNGSGEILLRK